MTAKDFQEKSSVAEQEEKILAWWQQEKIFAKSISRSSPKGDFVFYDGPPFATGTPHFGHLLPTSLKDVFPRFKTMQGFRVRRRWGWDCHGLPIENIIEKELGLASKKEIENYGIKKFNHLARQAVLRCADEWKKFIPRAGRFVDMDNDYRTMDVSYMETIWWVFKNLYDRGLIEKSFKSMHLCPRCETTLSNFEVSQGYKEIEDLSVVVKFPLVDQPKTFLLAWTTTPWTLPGNVALAINPNLTYIEVSVDDEVYILAANKEKEILVDKNYKINRQLSGQKLISFKYQPLFDVSLSADDRKTAWQVYPADFVDDAEGTGIVHIAPAFGEDDLNLARQLKLPIIQHITKAGIFKSETILAGKSAKPKDDHQATDKLIIDELKKINRLWKILPYHHTYPHCWRCDTPLLNYATSSWFVKVTDFKDKLVSANQEIDWIPAHIKKGRFGKWLANARDWAISRSRFWGAPLPVWRCSDCGRVEIFGSLADLEKFIPTANNQYFLMRHGQADSNLTDTISCQLPGAVLTSTGKQEVEASLQQLIGEKIDFIYSSDFARTKETASIAAKILNLPTEAIVFDERLREYNVGKNNDGSWHDYNSRFKTTEEHYNSRPVDGESVDDVKKRLNTFWQDLENDLQGKKVLIISHGLPLFLLVAIANGQSQNDILSTSDWGGMFETSEIKLVRYLPRPRNEAGETDLHRPYIDNVVGECSCGGKMHRIPDVFDCWFESGAMPYAQHHFPFSNKNDFDPNKDIGFPADFIAEGLDQTRGWFYSLLVLSTALYNRPAYKNVVANGIVLASDGQKMSKRLKNYPDLSLTINRYGADALRLYLLSSPVVKAEDVAFLETGLAEVYRRQIVRLLNVLNFFDTYADHQAGLGDDSVNILDQWIISRLNQLITEVTEGLENYEVDKAIKPLDAFIDDLSTWYLRRSRDRFKKSDKDTLYASRTLAWVLENLSKTIAPLAPFTAEIIYRRIKNEAPGVSVHLADWPSGGQVDNSLINDMKKARQLVEMILAERQKNEIKVRQPLSRATVPIEFKLSSTLASLVSEETNIKSFDWQAEMKEVILNTNITPELKAEGSLREIVRQLQNRRKKIGLNPGDRAVLSISGDDEVSAVFLKQHLSSIAKAINADLIDTQNGDEMKIDNLNFRVSLNKKD